MHVHVCLYAGVLVYAVGPGEDGPDFGALLPESLEMGDRGLDEDDDDDDDEENDPDYKDLSCGHFGERQEKRNDPAVKVSSALHLFTPCLLPVSV